VREIVLCRFNKNYADPLAIRCRAETQTLVLRRSKSIVGRALVKKSAVLSLIDDLFLDRLPKEVMAKIGVLCRIVNVRGGGKGIPCDYFGKGWDQEEGS
jgi:hypothetical protein